MTDIVFLRKRAPGEPGQHADAAWLETQPVSIEGADIPINRYFLNHPEMVLGTWSRQDRLYDAGYSVISNGDLAEQLRDAIRRLPECVASPAVSAVEAARPPFTPPPPLPHIAEGSFSWVTIV